MNLTKNEKGITLVALIITIIVLLVLAIVSIRAIKDGGILSKTQTSQKVYSESEEKEKIQLAINQAAIDGIGIIKEEHLTPALNEQFGEENWEYVEKKEGEYLVVKINASQRKYVVNINGTIEKYIGITLNPSKIGINNIGETAEITATLDGIEGELTWTSSSEETATVSGSGNKAIITAVSNGTATITAICGEKSATATVTVTVTKEGDEIELDADEDGTKETWIVLYKNTDNIEVISKNTMGELTLGKDDTEAQKEVPAVDENSLTDEEKIKRAIYSYNHAIERLNNYCASLIKIPNEGVRSVGTVPDDPSYRETSKPYTNKTLENWTEEKIELLKYGEAADGNYLNDQKQMSKLNIIRSNDDNKYWLGSRYCTDGTGPRVDFNIRFSNFGEIDSNGVSLVKVYKDKAPRFIGGTYAVRPIIKLQYP